MQIGVERSTWGAHGENMGGTWGAHGGNYLDVGPPFFRDVHLAVMSQSEQMNRSADKAKQQAAAEVDSSLKILVF